MKKKLIFSNNAKARMNDRFPLTSARTFLDVDMEEVIEVPNSRDIVMYGYLDSRVVKFVTRPASEKDHFIVITVYFDDREEDKGA